MIILFFLSFSRLQKIKPASSHYHSASRNEHVFYSLSLSRLTATPLSKADPFLILFNGVYRLVFKDSRHLRRTQHVVGVVEVVVVVVLARVRFPRVVCGQLPVDSVVSVSLDGMLLSTRTVPGVMVVLLRRGEWDVVHLVTLLLLYVVVIRWKVDTTISVVLSKSSVNVHCAGRQRILLTPERLRSVLVGHDKVIVRVRFRWSASRSRDGTFNRTASLIEVARLRGEVVHAPSIWGSCLLTVTVVDVFRREVRGSRGLDQVKTGRQHRGACLRSQSYLTANHLLKLFVDLVVL